MGEAMWWLILGTLLTKNDPASAWGSSCPAECSCHLSYFSDLPLNYWLESDTGSSDTRSKITEPNNEAYYEEDDPHRRLGVLDEPKDLLKMAMCIFQTSIIPSLLLDQLPTDTQVLSLLQGRNTGEILLEQESMQGFHNLIYLDVQGYSHDANQEIPDIKNGTNNSFMLSYDIFKPLISLQYLNLQNIKLLSPSEKDNKIHPINPPIMDADPISNEISISLPWVIVRNKDGGQQDEEKEHKLIFLKPPEPENEIVPYKTYLERKQQTGLSTFAGLSNLAFLRVYSCDLHDISWEMFDGLHKLKFLSLEQNHLLFIPEFAFYGTPNLKKLSLSHNKLLNMQSTSLAGLLKLEDLDVSHNKFSHLSEFSLPPFPKLKTANFKHNPIEAIFASTFEIMNATKILYLGGNSSTLDIHPNSFLGLHSLKKLGIDNVSIDLLERQLLSGMPELTELEIFGTIKALSFDAFVDVPKLEKLFLKDCKIETVSMDAFYGLYSLQILDISNNALETLPPGLFDHQFSLKELFLQNNLLTELPIGFFKNLPAKMVRLEGNPWRCSCTMKDWPPSIINKVKHKKVSLCQREYDKGSGCSSSYEEVYMYDKKVTPHCTTPQKYKGLGVFQVLRKELRCTKKLKNKLNRNFYLRKKHEEYEKLMKTGYYDEGRREYIEEIQRISKSRNNTNIFQKYKNATIQLKEKQMKQLTQPANTHMLETKSPSPDNTATSDEHLSVPQANLKPVVNIANELNNVHSHISNVKLEQHENNELSPIAIGNDSIDKDFGKNFKSNMAEINNMKLKDEKLIYNQKMQSQNLEKGTQNDKQIGNASPSVEPDKEAAKALKKIVNQEMERNRLKKLQKYYS